MVGEALVVAPGGFQQDIFLPDFQSSRLFHHISVTSNHVFHLNITKSKKIYAHNHYQLTLLLGTNLKINKKIS